MKANYKTKIQMSLAIFITLLALSGITAFPIQTELEYLFTIKHILPPIFEHWISSLGLWINSTPDIMFYGTDWLAFAHLVIALFFIPVYRKPVQYQGNIHIGMIACIGIFPVIFICGPLRGILFGHLLVDCSFGVIGFAVLYYINQQINRLKHESTNA